MKYKSIQRLMNMSIFRKLNPLYLSLLASVFFSFILILLRIKLTSSGVYLFLVWNLFLAFVPLLLALFMQNLFEKGKRSKLLYLPLLALWLLFLPNAPYIITDLFHLKPRSVPLWFDLVLILTFAWNGLVAGLISVSIVQQLIQKLVNTWFSWVLSIGAIFASSFGMYLGRYLRWNSWDLINHPGHILSDIAERAFHPFQHVGSLGMTICFSIFMVLAYSMLKVKETRIIVN